MNYSYIYIYIYSKVFQEISSKTSIQDKVIKTATTTKATFLELTICGDEN